MDLSLLVSVALIFLGTSLVVRSRIADRCLRSFHGFQVTLCRTDGRQVWGRMDLSPGGIEFAFSRAGGGRRPAQAGLSALPRGVSAHPVDPLRFEPFDRTHRDRSRFDCGVAALNDFLRTGLGQHGRTDLTRGFVAADARNRVVGYFTLAAGRLAVSVLPERGGLPTKRPLPTTLLAWLTVDKSRQGRGVGAALLAYALRPAVRGAESMASAVIDVEATDDAARSFYGPSWNFVGIVSRRVRPCRVAGLWEQAQAGMPERAHGR